MAPDMEMRASEALDAMDVLVELIDCQHTTGGVTGKDLAPLLRCVFSAVQKAVPNYTPRFSAND